MSIIRPMFRGEDYLEAVSAVYDERHRQVHEEGFDEAHDDRHLPGDLVNAARCYFNHPDEKFSYSDGRPSCWRWAWAWWKPGDRRTNLVKAGALGLVTEEPPADVRPGMSDQRLDELVRAAHRVMGPEGAAR